MPEKHHILKSPLLPCPFCGSAASLQMEGETSSRMLIQCTGEGCGATIKDYQDNGVEKLAVAWNKRAPQRPH